MPNIVEALQKAGGEIADLLQVLEDPIPTVDAPGTPGVSSEANGRANNRTVSTDSPVAAAQWPAPRSPEELLVEAQSAVTAVFGGTPSSLPPSLEPASSSTPNLNSLAPLSDRIRRLPLRLAGSAPLLPFDDTHSAAAEQYRLVRTRLVQHPKQPRLVLITSAAPGDGKSVTAVNIAGALSLKAGANVVLLDSDLRRSTIHTQLGLPASPGLSELLAGSATLEQALIQAEQFPNLYVIPAGNPHSNPSELLDSPRWRALCERLRGSFRYVIADSPPVASVADYELLQAAFDGVLLVVRPDHTQRPACLKALKTVPKDKLIGLVMNCVPRWFLSQTDGYGYTYCSYAQVGK